MINLEKKSQYLTEDLIDAVLNEFAQSQGYYGCMINEYLSDTVEIVQEEAASYNNAADKITVWRHSVYAECDSENVRYHI